MHVRCPQCGSEFFYIDRESGIVSFKITEGGEAEEPSKEAADLALSPNVQVFCTSCAWHGTVKELTSR